MRPVFCSLGVYALLATVSACGGGTVIVESTPRPDAAEPEKSVSAPSGRLEIPSPNAQWTPEAISSGLGSELVAALRDIKSLAMILPRGAAPLLEDRVLQMVKGAAPETKVVARGRAALNKLLKERGEIPYRVTKQQGGVDAFGRPYYVPKEHPLNTEWLAKKKPLKGAGGMLVVRPIRVDDVKRRRLGEGRRGGCADFTNALDSGIQKSDQFFRPYERETRQILASVFSRHLEVALPYWQAEMDRVAGSLEPGGAGSKCLTAYRSFVGNYKQCVDGACKAGPRFHFVEGGIIGMPDNAQLIPGNCPVEGMRDYRAELEDLARRAVSEALSSLDSDWIGELIRGGGLKRLRRILGEVCAPRHRRIDPKELEQAHADVDRFLRDLAGQEFSGEWEQARGMERVPGLGPAHVLARVRVSGRDPVAEATRMETRLRKLDRCDEGQERHYQAALIDVGTSEVVFMGIFFEEELLCEGFVPGSP